MDECCFLDVDYFCDGDGGNTAGDDVYEFRALNLEMGTGMCYFSLAL
jgi:hypothetical protein